MRAWLCIFAVVIVTAVHSNDAMGQCDPQPPTFVLRVDINAPQPQPGTPDGRSWSCAFTSLQAAMIEAAASGGDITEIWVADGTYTPSTGIDPNLDWFEHENPNDCDDPDRFVSFKLIVGVSMYGGFQGNSHPSGGETDKSQADPATYLTILSGDVEGNDDELENPNRLHDNAYHVVRWFHDPFDTTPSVTQWFIDGFVIQDGVANGGSQVDDCEFQGLLNSYGGGALIYAPRYTGTEPLSPRFQRCLFRNNVALNTGGAIASGEAGVFIRDCVFRDNVQTADDSTIVLPLEDDWELGGGAVSVQGPLRVITSKFVSNVSAYEAGGLVQAGGGNTTAHVVNCEFISNEAPNAGGAAVGSNGYVVNCLFAGNKATNQSAGQGGGLLGGAQTHGCTFVRNQAGLIGGGASPGGHVTHNIFWQNEVTGSTQPNPAWKAQVDMGSGGGPFNDYNLIQDWDCENFCQSGCTCAENNFDEDPLFLDDDGPDDVESTFEDNNYRLSEDSPAINIGDDQIENDNDNGYFPRDDFDADADGTGGQGEYEITPELDLGDRVYVDPGNHEGATRIDYGAYEAPCFINSDTCGDCVTSKTFQPPPDGKVDGADLAYLLGSWGECEDCCADKVTNATFQPPPDGIVDGADMAYLFGSWGWCCDFEQGSPSPLMGGGESMMSGESSGGESDSVVLPTGNPYDGTYLGLLLEELVATNDSDLVPIIAEMLQELLEE